MDNQKWEEQQRIMNLLHKLSLCVQGKRSGRDQITALKKARLRKAFEGD